MIKAVVKRNIKGNINEFCLSGHANYAKHGEDIVCSAVSALAQTAMLGLSHHANIEFEYEVKHGYLSFKMPENIEDHKYICANAILETMYLGLKNIREGYSSYIKIKEEEV